MADLGAAGGPDINRASSACSVCLPASPQDLAREGQRYRSRHWLETVEGGVGAVTQPGVR
jgi:hypothetical protein